MYGLHCEAEGEPRRERIWELVKSSHNRIQRQSLDAKYTIFAEGVSNS